MDRHDRRLERVRAEPPRRERPFNQCQSLGNLVAVPERTVLVVEQDQIPGGRAAPRRRDSWSSISASSPRTSGSGSSSTSRRPSWIASADRSGRVNESPDEAE